MIDKKDFEFLYLVKFMNYNNPEVLSENVDISKEEAEGKMKELEKMGLIEIEYKEEEIYDSQLTKKGEEFWNDDKYSKWKIELGY